MQTERWAKKKSIFLLCSAEVPPNLAKQSVQTERCGVVEIRKFVDYKTKKTDNYKNVIVCY